MEQRFKKVLVIAMATIGICSFVAKLLLFFYWNEHAPTTPNLANGQVYPLNNHGYVFYVTSAQHYLQDGLLYMFMIFAFGAAILNIRWKVIRNQYEKPNKKPY